MEKVLQYRDAGRESVSPGLRAAAIERVDVRTGVYKEIGPLAASRERQ